MNANKFLHSIERAPCELGQLLRDLPPHFPVSHILTEDEQLRLRAAISHAGNANFTVLNGIEAIGHLLFGAANNSEYPPSADVLENLGGLIRHLAVEAQFFQEQSEGFKSVLDTDHERGAAAVRSQKGGQK